MNKFRRLGAGVLALGVAAAGLVMTAPLASAHTGTLTTSSTCQPDGTYKVTYGGATKNVPSRGKGHTATLRVGEVKPVGNSIAGAPANVIGNTTYSFTQVVPGSTRSAQATAFLKWGDGAQSDPIGVITLGGGCKPPAPECVRDLNSGNVSAAYKDTDFHAVVRYTGQKPICAGASKTVSLNSYKTDGPTWASSGTQMFVDHDQVTISKDHLSGELDVDRPSCFYQTDLYWGSTR
jgi:hypothetical protein